MGQFQWVTSPMGLLGCPASFQRLLQPPVGPLDHPVALGVIGRGGVVVGPYDLTGACPEGGGELGPLVRRQVCGDAEAGDPVVD